MVDDACRFSRDDAAMLLERDQHSATSRRQAHGERDERTVGHLDFTATEKPSETSQRQQGPKTEPEQLRPPSRRFTTPTCDAAASLPTPLPLSPPAEVDNAAVLHKVGAASPSQEASNQSASTISRKDCGMVTPLTPEPSAFQLPPPAPATPRPPRSPTKASRIPLPLQSLIPCGTVLLRHCQIVSEAASAEDGWSTLAKGVLEQLQLPSIEESEPDVRILTEPEEEVEVPSPTKTKGKGKKKRKASHSAQASPAKRSKLDTPPQALLEVLLHLQDALILRATFLPVDDGVILRIYLVPVDAEELDSEEYTAGKRASPPDSTILRVLSAVRLDMAEWSGHIGADEAPKLMDEDDQRSILEVYRAVESPPLDPFFADSLNGASDVVKDRVASAIETGPAGLITQMYPYQKASLGKMLQRELAPQRTIDPAFLQRVSVIDGQAFYVSNRGEVASEPPHVTEPKSGILAEEMGSGKTLICLALVLSSLGELPDVSGAPTYLDGSILSPEPVVMTHRSRKFPFKTEMDEERSLRPRVPPPLIDVSLMDSIEVEMYERALARQAAEDAREVIPPLPTLRTLIIDFVRTSAIPIPFSPSDPRLLGTGLIEELADTCPYYNLRPSPHQLASRGGRTGMGSSSRIFVTSATLIVVPTGLVKQWEDEIKKHVEAGRLRVLVQRTKKDSFVTPQQLTAYDIILMSIARFSDAADDPTSSLRKVHLKRLLVDEGHALSSDNRMRKLAEEICVESRWAISGTPSQNLRAESTENALFAHDAVAGGNETDYTRLAELFSRYLRHPAIPKAETFRHLFTDPILKHGRGAERLGRLFNNSIVRNSSERIKQAYTLPPLTSEVVYVELGEAERRTMNALVATFVTNSILTQRIDVDYFFSPRNKKYLDELTDNLSAASSFFSSSDFQTRLADAIRNSEETLNSEKSSKWSEQDRQGLAKAISVMQEALRDSDWRAVVGSVGVNVEVHGLDEELIKLFGGVPKDKDTSLMPLQGLVTLRVNLKELQKPDVGAWKDDEDLREELITFEQKRQRLEALPANSKARAELEEEAKLKKKKRKKSDAALPPLPLPSASIFHHIQLGTTTSAKVNYVINDARLHPTEKIIVFSSALPDLVFAQLSEALDLVGISHAIFAGGRSGKGADRGAVAARFNTTSAKECQIILVDARLGGRGFCLTAASRVIMLEPIWVPDLEVQAAKRAHRLGQTKPVSLVVLVVPGSYEDALLRRRADLDPTDFAKTKQPQRDAKLANVLQSASYLEPSGKRPITLNPVRLIKAQAALDEKDDSPPPHPLPVLPRLLESPAVPSGHGSSGKRKLVVTSEGTQPKKAKKSVKFAEER